MQKKIIALAIAGLASTAAFAQSNVSIYGVVDMAAMHQSADGLKGTNRIESGGMAGSRIGFKGTEDLGNGLKALFTLEYNIAPDVNSGIGDSTTIAKNSGNIGTSTQSRQAFVGVTGNFGTAVAGRLQTAGFYFAAAYTPFAGTLFDNASLIGGNLVAGSGARLNNAVAYISPTFAGVTLEWDHARMSEDAGNQAGLTTGAKCGTTTTPLDCAGKDSYANELSAKYANGPFTAQGVFLSIKSDRTVVRDDNQQWGLGASYDFGVAKLMAMYKTTKTQTTSAATNDKTNSMWSLSASAPVSANGTVLASYAMSSIDTVKDADARGWGLGYRHALSKRTTVYANYTSISQDKNGNLAYATGYVASSAAGSQINAGTGTDSKVYGVGVSHSF